MLNVEEIRKDFKVLNQTMQGKPLVYLDSAATALKPTCVVEAMENYFYNICSNVHRGDYDLSTKADALFEEARKTVARFINASSDEIIFTSGATNALNLVAFGFALNNLEEGDEIILDEAEHASNVLPWVKAASMKGIVVKYAKLDENGCVTVDAYKEVVTKKTKLISVAYVTNVLGSTNDVKAIIKYAHENNILVCVDAAQAAAHKKIDVKDLDCDFLAFSGHKMCGPTGSGILYGKYELLEKTEPIQLGGSMNIKFDTDNTMLLRKPPYKFEGGTPAIAEVIGLKAAIDYLEKIGMDNIEKYEKELKEYAISKLSKLDNIVIYNKDNDSGIVTFNIKNVFCQDIGSYFNYKGIAVRTGHHCAKLLQKRFDNKGTVRASFYFYNTKEEIDKLVEACKTGGDYLDAFFA